MKKFMQRGLQAIILFVLFFAMVGIFSINVSAANELIFTISTNPGEDSNREMRINWHTALETTGTYVLYTTKDDTSWTYEKKIIGDSARNDSFNPAYTLNAKGESLMQCGAVLKNLKEGTEYMYKVGNDNYMSEVHYFKTGSQNYSFIWTSDFHAYYDNASRLNNATKNIEEAITINGGVDFVLSTGDTIAHGGTYQWWQQVAGASWMKRYMYADTLGNHDWMTSIGTTVADGASHVFFDATHNNPRNGYINGKDDQTNICYYFYYGDTLFINLNTEEYTQAQYDWCEEVLKNNDAQYKILFQHYQMFNDYGNASSTGYTRWWKLCDEYDVDLAIAGNSHVYMRSNSLYQDRVSTDITKGTTYITAPSSDGDRGKDFTGIYEVNKTRMAFGWAGGVYQIASSIVNVTTDGIRVRLVNNGGAILDDAFIPAKRGPSARYYKDITDFDKEEFEDNFTYVQSKLDSENGYINFPLSGINALTKIEVIKDGGIYSTHRLDDSPLNAFAINGYINGEYQLRLWYVDGVTNNITVKKTKSTSFGSLSNYKVGIENQKFKLTWDSDFTSDVKELQLYQDGELIKTLSKDIKTCEVDMTGELPKFMIKVIDNNNSLLWITNEISYYQVGDVNLDGKVDLEDVRNIQKYLLGTYVIRNIALPFADTNGDGKVALIDANYLNLFVSEKISSLSSKECTIVFRNPYGKVITTKKINIGGSITESIFVDTDEFKFIRWDKDLENIQSDMDVFAICDLCPEEITLSGASEVQLVGDTTQLITEIYPLYANDKLVYSSSDDNIATVDQSGLVTFVDNGTVTITAKSAWNDVQGTWEIKCDPIAEVAITADYIVYGNSTATSVLIDKTKYTFTAPVHTTITSAYNAASAGQKIVVLPGTYSADLVLDKAITLETLNKDCEIGSDRLTEAVITGKIAIKASNVIINGFKFTYTTSQSALNCYGLIYTTGGTDLSNITISYNDITSNGIGSHTGIIRLGNSTANTTMSNITISYNKIYSNGANSGISNRNRDATASPAQSSADVSNRTILSNVVISNNNIAGNSSYFGGLNLELGAGGSMTLRNNTIQSGTDHIVRFSSGSGTVKLIGHAASDVKFATNLTTVILSVVEE